MDRISYFSPHFPQPRGSYPAKEPIEPFIDGPLAPREEPPFLNQIQLSAEPLNKIGASQFLENLKPILENIHQYSRQDLQVVREHMHAFNEQIQRSDLSNIYKEKSQELYASYNQLLAQTTPFQHGKVLLHFDELERL